MDVVLFVKVIDQIGGTEVGTLRLGNKLASRGIRIRLISTRAMRLRHNEMVFYDYANHVDIIRLPVWQRSPTTFARMLRFHTYWIFPVLLRHTQILHLRSLSTETIQLARIAKYYGIKTVCVPAASGDFGDVAHLPYNILPSNAFDWISVLTPSMRAEVKSLGFPEERISVIPNGVDSSHLSPAQKPPKSPSVVFVGQFRPEKQVDLLLKAWQQVTKQHPKATLTLIGGGTNLEAHRQMAQSLDIAPTFVPIVQPDEVYDHLLNHNIFVMPGISEGMSNALLEAMAVGLAPVVSDTPANCDVIQNGVNGLTYASDSPSALAAQLIKLLQHDDLRTRLGDAARATICERYSLDRVADAYTAIYQRLLGEAD